MRCEQVSNRLGTFLGKPGWMVTFVNRRCSADEHNKDVDPGTADRQCSQVRVGTLQALVASDGGDGSSGSWQSV